MKSQSKSERGIISGAFPIIILLFVTLFSIVNKRLFYEYTNYALYINMLISCGGFIFLKGVKKTTVIYLLLVTVYLLISIMVSDGGFGSVVTFLVPLFLFIYLSKANFTIAQMKLVRCMCVVLFLYEIYYSLRYAENYRLYALSDINPNTIGMYIMFSFMIWSSLADLKNKVSRIFFFIGLFLALYGMYNCESRGTSFALLTYSLFLVIPSKFISAKRIMLATIVITVVGTAFPFIYIALYKNNINFEMFGKTLYTGREGIWLNMFEAMNDNFSAQIFGLGSKIELWEEHSLNVHNNYFNIIVNFGIIGFVLYFYFILKVMSVISRQYKDSTVYKFSMMFVSSVLLLGFSETTSLWSVIFIFAYISIGLAYGKAKEVEEGVTND